MLGYCTVGSNRLGEAKTFYDALLGSAGFAPLFEHPTGGRIGGTNEGAPGDRAPKMYFSYFRDLDGNKLCAFCMG
jgi:hypothetical protein